MSLSIQYDKQGKIYSPLREKYLVATPEEKVRQAFICTLVNHYGYELAQMSEELKTKDGKNSTRADIVIWKSIKDKQSSKNPFIIVECKADTIRISEEDYKQGESYARIANAPFFVTHNSYETRFWRVIKDKMPGFIQEIANIPKNNDTDKEIAKILDSLVVFKEDEFANLLHKCHNIIRNIEKLDPAAAFDEISKILFMKVYVERELLSGEQENKFTIAFLENAKKYNPDYLYDTFEKTKKIFAKDLIFDKDEKINLKEHTILRIIKELQIYNLSLTSTDVKGIAFERFLGRTFRGEIGQFFTPRSVVDFMVEMIDPLENEVVCDPASGSGGFLIRVFNKVRESIQKDIIRQYEAFKFKLIGDKNEEKITQEEAKKLNDKFQNLQKELQIDSLDSRLHKLSNHCIYGTDANDRMARTSKMNMIMHGDGHGGIHHHDGLLNVNGIFENRFDIILTNPPFGAQVEKEDKVQEKDTQFEVQKDGEKYKVKKGDNDEWLAKNEELAKKYYALYGKEIYQNAQAKIIENIGKPIAQLFALKENSTSDKTEHLFINRSLDLLKPSGRMGIVLPEGVFNTPNAEYVRKFVEGRAFLRAVISLPNETFLSSKASVKCSILFLQKFSVEEQTRWDNLLKSYRQDLEQDNKEKLDLLDEIIAYRKQKGEKVAKYSAEDKKRAKKELKELTERIEKEALSKTKIDFDYPIFMAEPEAVGITSTGETGDNVPNDLLDSFEVINNERVLKEKGIATHFREFLKTHNIAWNARDSLQDREAK
ncbi:N-6 DNA methylase [Helicobacter sp. 23-1046]